MPCDAVAKMRDGSLGVAFQRETSNHPLLLCPKGMVVNEWEKLRRDRGRYVSRR